MNLAKGIHCYNILPMNVSDLYNYPHDLDKDKLIAIRWIFLALISRPLNIGTVIWLLVIKLIRIYNKRSKKSRKKYNL